MTPSSDSTLEQAVLALAERQPLLRARDLTRQALPTVVLSRLVAVGKLDRVARGVYSLPGRALSWLRGLNSCGAACRLWVEKQNCPPGLQMRCTSFRTSSRSAWGT